MGNDFGLKVGMTMQQVISSLSTMNVTDKTKQFIIDFCANDYDKKITDVVELHVLNTWASGQEKIPMPDLKGVKGKDVCVQSNKRKASIGIFIDQENGRRKNTSISTLQDTDGDGFADSYSSFSHPNNVQHKGIDNNLDGKFDFNKKH